MVYRNNAVRASAIVGNVVPTLYGMTDIATDRVAAADSELVTTRDTYWT